MNNEKWELIKKLDLSSVKDKFKSKKGILWKWSNNADKLEAEYRQFLYLAVTHPEEVVVPWTQNLDDFWHEHILDTPKYEKDCQAIFGKMFHHNPNLPVASTAQVKAYQKTKEMYKESFGEKAKSSKPSSDDPGCGGLLFMPVFCGGGDVPQHSESSHSHSHDSGSHSSDSGSHSSDSGGHSCGGSSGGDSGGSSCGGGCGGGSD